MKHLFIFYFLLLLLVGCSNESLYTDEIITEDSPVTRAQGDVFRVRSLTERTETTIVPFSDWTIAPNGTIGCVYSKAYFHHYDVSNGYWPYYCDQTVLVQLLKDLNQSWSMTNAMATDDNGNWIFAVQSWDGIQASKLVKCSSDLSSLVEYTNALPDSAYILSLATNGSNILLGIGSGSLVDDKYDQLSIYNLSSRRVLTHIADIPLTANMRKYGMPSSEALSGLKLYKAKGDILYVAANGCADYFRVNISTGVVQSLTARFTPTVVATGSDCEYLYGIEDGKWIMQMRFDQSSDYEIGEIPDYCMLSDGTKGTIAKIESMVVRSDGSSFYLNALNREFNYWGAYTFQVYELYGVQ